MKLELKHLAPYLPYGLKFVANEEITMLLFQITLPHDQKPLWIQGFSENNKELRDVHPEGCQPLLRPLSDLTKEDWKEEVLMYYSDLDIDIRFYDSGNKEPNDLTLTVTYKLMGEVFGDLLIQRGSTKKTPRDFFEWLLENHFDVFGLIGAGLAIEKAL